MHDPFHFCLHTIKERSGKCLHAFQTMSRSTHTAMIMDILKKLSKALTMHLKVELKSSPGCGIDTVLLRRSCSSYKQHRNQHTNRKAYNISKLLERKALSIRHSGLAIYPVCITHSFTSQPKTRTPVNQRAKSRNMEHEQVTQSGTYYLYSLDQNM